MTESRQPGTVTIRLFGFLRYWMKDKGLPDCLEKPIPAAGRSGRGLARDLGLPEERIEAVFRNGVIQRLDEDVFPGDRVAFVPPGTPGPYRVLLGMVRGEGKPGP
jgi:molybdopterin converting factor small subunit